MTVWANLIETERSVLPRVLQIRFRGKNELQKGLRILIWESLWLRFAPDICILPVTKSLRHLLGHIATSSLGHQAEETEEGDRVMSVGVESASDSTSQTS